jgi:hypothetical protein
MHDTMIIFRLMIDIYLFIEILYYYITRANDFVFIERRVNAAYFRPYTRQLSIQHKLLIRSLYTILISRLHIFSPRLVILLLIARGHFAHTISRAHISDEIAITYQVDFILSSTH